MKGATDWQVKKTWIYGGDKVIKNGSKITKNISDVGVRLYNKKTKVTEEIWLDWGFVMS